MTMIGHGLDIELRTASNEWNSGIEQSTGRWMLDVFGRGEGGTGVGQASPIHEEKSLCGD